MRMRHKRPLIVLLCCIALLVAPQVAKAATITSASLDKDTYLAGQTGYISVTVYNDQSQRIRVTELSVTVDYYYADETVYVQKFFANAVLPDEIEVGQSKTYQIPISLPTNIAAGYTDLSVEAKNEIWVPQIERWWSSETATYHLKLYIQSPYKQMYETTEDLLQEQIASNTNLSNMVGMLTVASVAFMGVAGLLMFLLFIRRPRPVA